MAYETTDEIMRLCDVVGQTGFDPRKYHGSGHLEKIYENGLARHLRKQGNCVEQQSPIAVLDEDNMPLGDNFADLLINFGAPKYEIKKYVLSDC